MPPLRRVLLVLAAATASGLLAAALKDQGGDGLGTASQVRGALGNLSTPWLLVGLVAGATCSRAASGALLGVAATLAALTGFYVLTGAVVGVDGQRFPASVLLWVAANRVYYLAGIAAGALCGAAGAWWRARRAGRTGPVRSGLVVAGALLVGEPLVLGVMGLVLPSGAVQAPQAPALARSLLSLLGSWTLTSSRPPSQLAVYAAEAAAGVLLLVLAAHGDRRLHDPARAGSRPTR